MRKVGRPSLQLNKSEITALFDMPQQSAAKLLGVSLSGLKKECRKFGIPHWPYKRSWSIPNGVVSAIGHGTNTLISQTCCSEVQEGAAPPPPEQCRPNTCVSVTMNKTPASGQWTLNQASMVNQMGADKLQMPQLLLEYQAPSAMGMRESVLGGWQTAQPPQVPRDVRPSAPAQALLGVIPKNPWAELGYCSQDPSKGSTRDPVVPLHRSLPLNYVHGCHCATSSPGSRPQDSGGQSVRSSDHLQANTNIGYRELPGAATSSADHLRFLQSVPATTGLDQNLSFINGMEARTNDGYAGGITSEGITCLQPSSQQRSVFQFQPVLAFQTQPASSSGFEALRFTQKVQLGSPYFRGP